MSSLSSDGPLQIKSALTFLINVLITLQIALNAHVSSLIHLVVSGLHHPNTGTMG